jgi:hypothetical protein
MTTLHGSYRHAHLTYALSGRNFRIGVFCRGKGSNGKTYIASFDLCDHSKNKKALSDALRRIEGETHWTFEHSEILNASDALSRAEAALRAGREGDLT